LAELQYGVANSIHQEQNQSNLDNFLTKLEILDFSASCAFFMGK
jgi:predicted nucleic acid-binding protein